MLIGSGSFTTIILITMASAGASGRLRPLMRDVMYVLFLVSCAKLMKRGILLWVPVGVFFTRHVYSFASITGSSMQASHLSCFASTKEKLLIPANIQSGPGTFTIPPRCSLTTTLVDLVTPIQTRRRSNSLLPPEPRFIDDQTNNRTRRRSSDSTTAKWTYACKDPCGTLLG